MVLKSKVGSYQLHKENKNVQNKEIFLYFIFSANSFLVYFYFTQITIVRNIPFSPLASFANYLRYNKACYSRF